MMSLLLKRALRLDSDSNLLIKQKECSAARTLSRILTHKKSEIVNFYGCIKTHKLALVLNFPPFEKEPPAHPAFVVQML